MMKFEINKLSKYLFLGIWTIVRLFKLLYDTKINNCVIVSISKFVKILGFLIFLEYCKMTQNFTIMPSTILLIRRGTLNNYLHLQARAMQFD